MSKKEQNIAVGILSEELRLDHEFFETWKNGLQATIKGAFSTSSYGDKIPPAHLDIICTSAASLFLNMIILKGDQGK